MQGTGSKDGASLVGTWHALPRPQGQLQLLEIRLAPVCTQTPLRSYFRPPGSLLPAANLPRASCLELATFAAQASPHPYRHSLDQDARPIVNALLPCFVPPAAPSPSLKHIPFPPQKGCLHRPQRRQTLRQSPSNQPSDVHPPPALDASLPCRKLAWPRRLAVGWAASMSYGNSFLPSPKDRRCKLPPP